MNTTGRSSRRRRFIRPHALFLGVACGFLACCLAGRLVAGHNLYRDFTWFHPLINPQSLYRPTASQFLALAESDLSPDQVLVVVAGNSVMMAGHQGKDGVWTKHLQRLLGDHYRVFNFAMNGVGSGDFGALAAEMLSLRHPRVVCITDTWVGTAIGSGYGPDRGTQPYLFWDAYCKGLLITDHPEREAALAENRRTGGESYDETERHGELDTLLRFDDLWTTVSYRGVSTVWTPKTAASPWKARRRYDDPYSRDFPPIPERYPASGEEQQRTLAGEVGNRHWDGAAAARPEPDYSDSPLIRHFSQCFPRSLRPHTLVVVNRFSPRFLRRLDAATLKRHNADFPETIRALEQAGFAAMDLGKAYTELDFVDSCHISIEGSPKMAADIAPKVRELARDLGYAD
jgi:hypothetical protein